MIRQWLLRRLKRMADSRPADNVIGGREHPYLRRWHVIPRNPIFNIYFHEFRRSDDDRAPHDHPWINISWLLEGSYVEWVDSPYIDAYEARLRRPGALIARRPKTMHRIQLHRDDGGEEMWVYTLFITGPRVRQWGFRCPKGWVHWREFTSHSTTGDSTVVGKGCD
jgi:hypothetical protein